MKSDVTKMRMRATPEARALIFGAAKRSGVNVSKFVVQASVERAVRILDRQENSSALVEMNATFFAFLDEEDRRRRKKIEAKPEASA
jgi:uncharacterized protein (DUF1778 family)